MIRVPIAALIATVVAAGCAASPKQVESTEVSSSRISEGQPPNVSQQMHTVTRLPSPNSGDFELSPIRPASHVTATAPSSDDALFGPDAGLDELIAFALANNPEIQVVHMQAHALEARVPQARALDDPMLMTTAFLEPIQTAAGAQDVILNLSQKVPWFGKRELRGQVAFQDAQATFARMAAAELSVVEQVKLAYYELYFLDRAIVVNKELEGRLEEVIAITESKYRTAREKTGLESVLQAQVELFQLQTLLIQLEQAKDKAKARLARALHAPRGTTLDVVPAIPETNVPRSAEVLVAMIEHCQPNLEAVRRQRIGDQSAIALAQKNYYPDVTVGVNYYGIDSKGLSPMATGDDAFSLLIGVNVPIYREKLDAGVREAQFKAARTAHQYEALWDEVRAEVQTQHAQFIENDRVFKILDKDILPKSQQTLDLSFEAYRVDRITFQQLIENYKTLLRHRIDYHRRLAQRAQAIATLERAVGCAITTWPIDIEEILPGPESVDLK